MDQWRTGANRQNHTAKSCIIIAEMIHPLMVQAFKHRHQAAFVEEGEDFAAADLICAQHIQRWLLSRKERIDRGKNVIGKDTVGKGAGVSIITPTI